MVLWCHNFYKVDMHLYFMNGDDSGLTEVPRIERHYDRNHERNFNEGDVRKAFRKVFSPGKDYVLFKTVVNQEAVNILEQHVMCHNNSEGWEVEIIQTSKLSRSDERNRLQFSNNLMDSYRRVIDDVAGDVLGRGNFSHYPVLSTNSVHSMGRDPNDIFWPIVYIVDVDKKMDLYNVIEGLAAGKFFEMLKNNESPYFYRMAEIKVLDDLRVAPIVRSPEETRLGAKDLSIYVDLLAQITESDE